MAERDGASDNGVSDYVDSPDNNAEIGGVDARRVVHGIDFSGARDAGHKIRIATVVVENGLRIERCRSVAEIIGTTERDPALDYLRDFSAGEHDAVVGLDFSFGVPRAVTDAGSWHAFCRTFPFESVEAMVDTYVRRTRQETDGKRTYLKRETDTETGASSPYGFLVSSQTFYGIRDVLRPLVRGERVSVLPMGDPRGGRPWLCEIYPAATLRDLGLPDERYKNDDTYSEAPNRRERIVAGLREAGVTFAEEALVETAIDDSGGDALDSIVAAFAVSRALRDERLIAANDALGERRALEGHIYI